MVISDWKETIHTNVRHAGGDLLDYPNPASIPAIVPIVQSASGVNVLKSLLYLKQILYPYLRFPPNLSF